jgi:hypothetical protein
VATWRSSSLAAFDMDDVFAQVGSLEGTLRDASAQQRQTIAHALNSCYAAGQQHVQCAEYALAAVFRNAGLGCMFATTPAGRARWDHRAQHDPFFTSDTDSGERCEVSITTIASAFRYVDQLLHPDRRSGQSLASPFIQDLLNSGFRTHKLIGDWDFMLAYWDAAKQQAGPIAFPPVRRRLACCVPTSSSVPGHFSPSFSSMWSSEGRVGSA